MMAGSHSTVKSSSLIRRFSTSLMATWWYQTVMYVALLMSLYIPDIWVIQNVASYNAENAVLLTLFGLFMLDSTLLCIAQPRTYPFSLMFWFDQLSAVSLFLDITWAWGDGSENMQYGTRNSTIVLLRLVRIARQLARVGRIYRLIRSVQLFITGKKQAAQRLAAALASRVAESLSLRVSVAVLLVGLISPIFSLFGGMNDLSVQVYPRDLAEIYRNVTLGGSASEYADDRYQSVLAQMTSFYAAQTYSPVSVSLSPPYGTDYESFNTTFSERATRVSDRLIASYNDTLYGGGYASIEYDMSYPNRLNAWLNVGLTSFVLVALFIATASVIVAVNQTVLDPVERLLSSVRDLGKTIIKEVGEIAPPDSADIDDDYKDEALESETALLERIARKLQVIRDSQMRPDQQAMGSEARAVVSMLTGQSGNEDAYSNEKRASLTTSLGDSPGKFALENSLMQAGITPATLNSWDLDPLALSPAVQMDVINWIFIGSLFSGSIAPLIDVEKLGNFLQAVAARYKATNPYHNWTHAIDVTHTVYRLMTEMDANDFLKPYERLALLVASVAHDVGHPGVNNGFLVDSTDPLAMRYNDRSPLENMHCAVLFEIAAESGIFSKLTKEQYRDARKLAVEVILHTDNVFHFAMVKDLQLFYQLNKETLDAGGDNRKALFTTQDNKMLLAKAILHTADISNQSKPWHICNKWSMLVMQEFFAQGDQEKAAGITVQLMNDRNKVNIPLSQVGFIEFVVAPLYNVQVSLFAQLRPCADAVATNMIKWGKMWVTEVHPSEEDKSKTLLRIKNTIAKFEDRVDIIVPLSLD